MATDMQAKSLVITLVALATVASCTPQPLALPGRGGGPRDPMTPGRPGEPQRIEADVDRKRVTGKEPATTLVADDRTVCVVSRETYDAVKVGDQVWCAWRRP